MPAKLQREKALRKALLDKKMKMWNVLRDELFRKLGKEYNVMFENPNDIEELSIIDVIEETGISIADIHRKELEELDEAINKLDDGTYGICSVCGNEIDEERLKVVLSAATCIDCARERDKKA
ncbi:TraR/DksA family transcriptional regulator [bacterium]|nr:MAG: TraR/DksA family transcriptional regulator [bacterium]